MVDLERIRHPNDSKLLGQLLDAAVVKQTFSFCREKQLDNAIMYAYRSSCIEITEENFPALYHIVQKTCTQFGVLRVPLCFLVHNYEEKIELAGLFQPILLISNDYINRVSDSVLYGTISSQIGSIALGHQSGVGLSWILENCLELLPIPGAALVTIQSILNQWKRSRWFSCDRACLVATRSLTDTLYTLFDNAVPPEILGKFRFGESSDEYEEQYCLFSQKSATKDISTAMNSFLSDVSWIPDRYRELKAFYGVNRKWIAEDVE